MQTLKERLLLVFSVYGIDCQRTLTPRLFTVDPLATLLFLFPTHSPLTALSPPGSSWVAQPPRPNLLELPHLHAPKHLRHPRRADEKGR